MATRLCEYINLEDPTARFKTLIPCNLGPHDKFDPNTDIFTCNHLQGSPSKIEGAPNVEIWGDGKVSEFMYAPDLADAVLRAANYIETCPQLINIGLGHDFTINEYYSEVADVIDWQGNFTHDLSRPVGMNQKLCDVRRQQSGLECQLPACWHRKTYKFYYKGG